MEGRETFLFDAIHVALQIEIKEFKDQVQLVVIVNYIQQSKRSEVSRAMAGLPDNVLVLQFLEDGNFTNRRGRHPFFLALQTNLF